jgi:hypothetical protein
VAALSTIPFALSPNALKSIANLHHRVNLVPVGAHLAGRRGLLKSTWRRRESNGLRFPFCRANQEMSCCALCVDYDFEPAKWPGKRRF